MRYLLDTNILSDLVRHPQGCVAKHIEQVGEYQVCTSIIVAAELRYGAAKKASPRLMAQLNVILNSIAILPMDVPVDQTYGALRAEFERAGRPIGGNDLLIAAQAISQSSILVTDNEHQFRRIKGLSCENWLRSLTPS